MYANILREFKFREWWIHKYHQKLRSRKLTVFCKTILFEEKLMISVFENKLDPFVVE